MNGTERELLLKLHDKIDEIKTDLGDIKTVQGIHENNLAEHMRRTNIVEVRQDLIENEVKPILQGLGFFKSFCKFVLASSGIIYSILKFLK